MTQGEEQDRDLREGAVDGKSVSPFLEGVIIVDPPGVQRVGAARVFLTDRDDTYDGT